MKKLTENGTKCGEGHHWPKLIRQAARSCHIFGAMIKTRKSRKEKQKRNKGNKSTRGSKSEEMISKDKR